MGAYDEAGQAWLAIENWLKKNNRKAEVEPFEICLHDPAMVKDPAEISTAIYQPPE